ncbi:MAG: hypothetical protein CMO01_08085 [Thalassobius sp.]|nr:hypothetical protein [Thalassovita sp.]
MQIDNLFGYFIEDLIDQNMKLLIPENFKEQRIKHREQYFQNPKLRPININLEPLRLKKI